MEISVGDNKYNIRPAPPSHFPFFIVVADYLEMKPKNVNHAIEISRNIDTLLSKIFEASCDPLPSQSDALEIFAKIMDITIEKLKQAKFFRDQVELANKERVSVGDR